MNTFQFQINVLQNRTLWLNKEVEVKVLIEALKNEKHCDSFYLK